MDISLLKREVVEIESKLNDSAQTLHPKTIDLLRSRLAYLKDKIRSMEKGPE